MGVVIIFTPHRAFLLLDSLVDRTITNGPGRSENIFKSYTVPPSGRRVG